MYIDRDEKLFDKVCMPIYQELFKKAEPSANFKKMLKTKEAFKDNFFYNYYLPDDVAEEIIGKHIKKNTKKLSIRTYEKSKIRTTILLGCSPTGSKKRWESRKSKKE